MKKDAAKEKKMSKDKMPKKMEKDGAASKAKPGMSMVSKKRIDAYGAKKKK